ncbi:hypothetical protein ACXZ9C_11455 [Streptococcus agalactiae]
MAWRRRRVAWSWRRRRRITASAWRVVAWRRVVGVAQHRGVASRRGVAWLVGVASAWSSLSGSSSSWLVRRGVGARWFRGVGGVGRSRWSLVTGRVERFVG